MTTNFDIGLATTPSFRPQVVYSQNLNFVPSSGDTLPSVIRGVDSLPARSDGYERVRVMVFWIELRGYLHDSLALQATVRSYQRVKFPYACSK